MKSKYLNSFLFLIHCLNHFISVQYIKINFIKIYQDNLYVVILVTNWFMILFLQLIISHFVPMESQIVNYLFMIDTFT